MKITPSPLIASLHKSAADACAVRGRSSNYIKIKRSPRNPRTEKQIAWRRNVARMSLWWNSLPLHIRSLADRAANLDPLNGFDAMSHLALAQIAQGDPPNLIALNPIVHPILALWDIGAGGWQNVHLDFLIGPADPNNHVLFFTCPRTPTLPNAEDPDVWTVHDETRPCISPPDSIWLPVKRTGPAYYVCAAVIDISHWRFATAISGSVACIAFSGY